MIEYADLVEDKFGNTYLLNGEGHIYRLHNESGNWQAEYVSYLGGGSTLQVDSAGVLYSLPYDFYLLRSTDQGVSWQRRNAPFPIVDMLIDRQSRLYTWSDNIVFSSGDGGKNWAVILNKKNNHIRISCGYVSPSGYLIVGALWQGMFRGRVPAPTVGVDAIRSSTAMTVHVAPNPCFGPTSFAIDLPKAGEVSVDLYDVYGRRVRRLMEGPAEAGRMSLPCDPIGLPGGAYQVVVRSDEGVASARMLLAR